MRGWKRRVFLGMACFMMASWAGAVKYPRQDLVNVEMTTKVTFLGENQDLVFDVISVRLGGREVVHVEAPAFLYEVTVHSLPDSRQEVWDVGIDLTPEVFAETRVLESWLERVTSMGEPFLGQFSYPGYAGTTWISWFFSANRGVGDERNLLPGESVGSYPFVSRGLPGIRPMLARGEVDWEDLPDEEDLPPEDPEGREIPVENPEALDPIEGAFHGMTVGPDVLLGGKTEKEILERMIALKDRAAGMGWIKSPGIVTSLNQKLKNALKDLKKGNQEAASGVLKAFLNELEAQKGKHINENAYWLLRANAEFLIDRLE